MDKAIPSGSEIENRVGFIGNRSNGREGTRENTGNFLHGYAARHIIKGNHIQVYREQINDESAQALRGRISHLAYVAATTIMVNKPLSPAQAQKQAMLADAIEKLKLPVIVFGLGAQASLGTSVQGAEIAPETRRLLSVLSHHSSQIAVRGEFTASICKSLGINNIEIIGCQSCFLSCRPDFKLPPLTHSPQVAKTILTVTHHVHERSLLVAAMEGNATFIGQSEHFEYNLKKIDNPITFDDIPRDVQALVKPGMKQFFDSGAIDFQKFHAWIREHFFQYYSMEPWFEKIKQGHEACIGTRFHGNMAAMLSGVPTLWVVHDTRTEEFCNYLGLPNITLKQATAGSSISELFERHYDTSAFSRKYSGNYAKFFNYMNLHGVQHRLAAPLTEPAASQM
ncbi:hypothetical protein GG851_25595 [Bordetella petrii]|nr:hypothetical protein [Bordetella petrii]